MNLGRFGMSMEAIHFLIVGIALKSSNDKLPSIALEGINLGDLEGLKDALHVSMK